MKSDPLARDASHQRAEDEERGEDRARERTRTSAIERREVAAAAIAHAIETASPARPMKASGRLSTPATISAVEAAIQSIDSGIWRAGGIPGPG